MSKVRPTDYTLYVASCSKSDLMGFLEPFHEDIHIEGPPGMQLRFCFRGCGGFLRLEPKEVPDEIPEEQS